MIDNLHKFHWYLSKTREYPGIHQIINDLDKESRLSTLQWENLGIDRLRKLLVSAKETVPYYQRIFREIDFNPKTAFLPKDFKKVPILTKTIIRKEVGQLLAQGQRGKRVFKNATGGSTGVPLVFYQDLQYKTIANALDAHILNWLGIQAYDKKAAIWGADKEFKDFSYKEKLYLWRFRLKSLNAFRMNEEGLLNFYLLLKKWKPPYLMGYSSALETFSKFLKAKGIGNLRFKAIRSTAEMLWPHQRLSIENTFDSPVFNFYGSREVNNIAADCPEEHSLHLGSTWRYLEIIDKEGKPVPDGQYGDILVTDLSNFTMPFIRYRIEDMGCFSTQSCPCGRVSPVIEKLLGRTTDIIKTPSGEIIHGEFFTHLFYGRNDISMFQVHQTALNRLILRIVPDGLPPVEFMNKVKEKIKAKIGKDVHIDIEFKEEIPLPESGKHRFTISDIAK